MVVVMVERSAVYLVLLMAVCLVGSMAAVKVGLWGWKAPMWAVSMVVVMVMCLVVLLDQPLVRLTKRATKTKNERR